VAADTAAEVENAGRRRDLQQVGNLIHFFYRMLYPWEREQHRLPGIPEGIVFIPGFYCIHSYTSTILIFKLPEQPGEYFMSK
jgi:hypothetical protein